MYNQYPQKPYYHPQQPNTIELEDPDPNIVAHQKLISQLSDGVTKLMLPLYDQFKDYTTQDGRIMGHYPVLKFPSKEEQYYPPPHQSYRKSAPMNYDFSYDSIEPNPYAKVQQNTFQKANFNQLAHRVQEKEKRQMQHSISERKIHQLLDQNEAGEYTEGGDNYDDRYSSQAIERRRLEKARKHYEKLVKESKSGKRYKKRFKDKNRPKKAKSAYNLFVEDVVPRIKAENPSFSAPNLVRVAAKMYNELTEAEKIPYQQRYLIDKERFERERQQYFKKHPEMDYRLDARQKASYAQHMQHSKYRQ